PLLNGVYRAIVINDKRHTLICTLIVKTVRSNRPQFEFFLTARLGKQLTVLDGNTDDKAGRYLVVSHVAFIQGTGFLRGRHHRREQKHSGHTGEQSLERSFEYTVSMHG